MRSLRRDYCIYNEANGFVITSEALCGTGLRERDAGWLAAVAKGRIIPISLVQDDPLIMRILIGEPMSDAEEAAAVGRFAARLEVPDGRLVIAGGAECLGAAYDEDARRFVQVLDVPASTYRVEVVTLATGVNGAACRRAAGEAVPAGDGAGGVDFVLRLDADFSDTATAPIAEDSWVPEVVAPRRPSGQARTIEPVDPVPAWEPAGAAVAACGTWLESRGCWPAPVPGDPVELAPSDLVHLFRVAWFACTRACPEVTVELPAGAAWVPGDALEDGLFARKTAAGWTIGYAPTGDALRPIRAAALLGARLAGLPDGTRLELRSAVPDAPEDDLAGWQWSRGVVADGRWTIQDAYTAVPADTLRAALGLALEAATLTGFMLHDEAEVQHVRDLARHDDFAMGLAPADGLRLSMRSADLNEQLGSIVFAARFGDAWPVWKPAPPTPAQAAADRAASLLAAFMPKG